MTKAASLLPTRDAQAALILREAAGDPELGRQVLALIDHAGGAAETWRAYASLTESANRHAFVRTVRAVIDPGGQSVSARDRLYLMSNVPTLIMWGDQDHIIPVDHAHATHRAVPASRLEIIEGSGHFPHVEMPDRFAEVLTDFVHTTKPADLHLNDFVALLREGNQG